MYVGTRFWEHALIEIQKIIFDFEEDGIGKAFYQGHWSTTDTKGAKNTERRLR